MISSLHKGSYCSSQNRYLSQQAVILNVGIDKKNPILVLTDTTNDEIFVSEVFINHRLCLSLSHLE
jgi:hypothetical protein